MTDQLALRLGDPQNIDTSALAASLDRTLVKAHVLEVLVANPEGLTDWELTDKLAVYGYTRDDKPTIGKRREEWACEIVRDADGKPVTRLSPKGSPCKRWRLPTSCAMRGCNSGWGLRFDPETEWHKARWVCADHASPRVETEAGAA